MEWSIALLIFISFEFVCRCFEGSGKPQSPEHLKLALLKNEIVQMFLDFLNCPVPLCHYSWD